MYLVMNNYEIYFILLSESKNSSIIFGLYSVIHINYYIIITSEQSYLHSEIFYE